MTLETCSRTRPHSADFISLVESTKPLWCPSSLLVSLPVILRYNNWTRTSLTCLRHSSLLSMVGAAQPALISFPSERPVFVREYSTNHYSVLSYFLSRFVLEAVVTALQCLMIVSCSTQIFLGEHKLRTHTLFVVSVPYHLFHDWFQDVLHPVLHYQLCSGNVSNCNVGVVWMRHRRPEPRHSAVPNAVCTPNAVRWLLYHPFPHPCLAQVGALPVPTDVWYHNRHAGRIRRLRSRVRPNQLQHPS